MNRLIPISMLPLLIALGCASSPTTQSFSSRVLEPGSNEQVRVEQTLILIDASGSTEEQYAEQMRLVEAFVDGMPEGSYTTEVVGFGGSKRQRAKRQPFQRGALRGQVGKIQHTGSHTPIAQVFEEGAMRYKGASGDLAVVLFSDGVANLPYGSQDPEASLAAARKLVAAHRGNVCIHTVRIGEIEEGAVLMEQLSTLTPCGSSTTAAGLSSTESLYAMQRVAFLEAGLPAVAAAPPRIGDRDRDGVLDPDDQCPNTPVGASVDRRGCWTLTNIQFSLDSDAIATTYQPELENVVTVLRDNPSMRIRIDGHTDASGAEAYNQALSERRAGAVRDYIVNQGLDGDRLEVWGFGEARPAADNKTKEGRRENRRTELSVVQ